MKTEARKFPGLPSHNYEFELFTLKNGMVVCLWLVVIPVYLRSLSGTIPPCGSTPLRYLARNFSMAR